MIATKPGTDFTSLGQLCALLQRSPQEIQRAAGDLQIVAAMRLNQVAHFDAGQVQELAAHFRNQDGN